MDALEVAQRQGYSMQRDGKGMWVAASLAPQQHTRTPPPPPPPSPPHPLLLPSLPSLHLLPSSSKISPRAFLHARHLFLSHVLMRLQPFHSQDWTISNVSDSLTRNITSHRMKNLVSHSLFRWKMIILLILTTRLTQFLFWNLGGCTFWNWFFSENILSTGMISSPTRPRPSFIVKAKYFFSSALHQSRPNPPCPVYTILLPFFSGEVSLCPHFHPRPHPHDFLPEAIFSRPHSSHNTSK